MFKWWLRHLVGSKLCALQKTSRRTDQPRRKRVKLDAERLEDRLAPTITVWTDGDANHLWSDGNNWSTGHAPNATEIAVFDNTQPGGRNDSSIIDSAISGSIQGIEISHYTGTISDSLNSLALGSSGYSQSDPASTFQVPGTGLIFDAGNWFHQGGIFSAGSGTVDFFGSGTRTVNNGGDSFTNVGVSFGTLQLTGNPLTATGNLAVNGTLDMNGLDLTAGNLSGGGTVTNNAAGTGTDTLQVSGGGSFAGSITDGATARVALTVGGTTQTLGLTGTNNTYSGATTINSGDTLQVGASNATSANSSVTDNGTLDLNGFSTIINGLSGGGSVTNNAAGTGPGTLQVNGGGSFAGSITDGATGRVALTVGGTGTFRLSGTNTYTGPTKVAGGTLQVDGTITSDVTLSGGTLSGDGRVGTVTATSGGVSPGDGTTPGILTTGALDLPVGTSDAVTGIGGNTAGSGSGFYAQDDVASGTITLGGTLNLPTSSSYTPQANDVYLIINNETANNAVIGNFVAGTGITAVSAGTTLTEGTILSTNFLNSGLTAYITYLAGTHGDSVAVAIRAVPPQVTTLSTTFVTGQPGTFQLLANGSTPISFTAGTGVNAPPAWLTLSASGVLSGTPPAGTSGTFTFQVTAANSAGSDTEIFTLSVVTPPQVTTQPTNQTITAGANATFVAHATGSPTPTVQWFVQTHGVGAFTAIPGATSDTLTIANALATDSTNVYHAVYTSAAGTTTTTNVTLTVVDHFTISAPASVSAGTAFGITVTARDTYGNVATGYLGTVKFASSDGGAALPGKYTFTASDNGVHTFTGLKLRKKGTQTIMVFDASKKAILGTISINVL
jgi:autotransporter-associated beta strand protein